MSKDLFLKPKTGFFFFLVSTTYNTPNHDAEGHVEW